MSVRIMGTMKKNEDRRWNIIIISLGQTGNAFLIRPTIKEAIRSVDTV